MHAIMSTELNMLLILHARVVKHKPILDVDTHNLERIQLHSLLNLPERIVPIEP